MQLAGIQRSTEGVLRLSSAIALLALALLVGACAEHTAEVAKGDPEYPVEDSTAHFVPLTAVIPKTLRVRLTADYAAQENDPSCLQPVGPGVRHALSLRLPLQLESEGELHRGNLAPDRFLPGRCGWFLAGVSYVVEGSDSAPRFFARYIRRPGNPAEARADVWCLKRPNVSPRTDICSGLANLISSFPGAFRPEFLPTVPDAERGNGQPVLVDGSTRSIAVYFHDLETTAAMEQMDLNGK